MGDRSGRLLPLVVTVVFLLLSMGCMHVGTAPSEERPLLVPEVLEDWQPIWQPVARGVAYSFVEEKGSRPRVHLLRIDLASEGLHIQVPPPVQHGAKPEEMWKTLHQGSKLPIALWNSSPFRYRSKLWRRGMDPVGLQISEGRLYSRQEKDWGYVGRKIGEEVVISRSPSLGQEEVSSLKWAVGGYLPILVGGKNIGIDGERHARTAVGASSGGTVLFVCVVEGEYSSMRGLTSRETAFFLRKAGAWEALNLDGGNSSFLLLRMGNGDLLYYHGGRTRLPCFMGLIAESAF